MKLKEIREFVDRADVKGERYPPELLAQSYVDTI